MIRFMYWSAPSCPVIQTDKGVIQSDLTDYLIYRKFTSRMDYSTVANDARHLTVWQNYLEENDLSLYKASSLTVEHFRDFLDKKDLSKAYINKHLITICAFYWWAQKEGIVSNIIGWKDKSSKTEFSIRVDKQSANSKSSLEYRIPYTLKTIKSPQLSIPNSTDIDYAEERILKMVSHQNAELAEAVTVRDLLIFHWLTKVGLRRNELVSLEVNDIPKDLGSFMIEVVINKGTKFGKSRKVQVPRPLIEETLQYIKYERADILTAKKARFGNSSAVRELFVNAGNAAVRAKMDSKTVYDFLTKISDKINPHACRRYALTNFATVLYRLEIALAGESADKERIIKNNLLQIVARQAGHEDPDTTIRFYVDTAQARYLAESGFENLSNREAELELELMLIRQRKQTSARGQFG